MNIKMGTEWNRNFLYRLQIETILEPHTRPTS